MFYHCCNIFRVGHPSKSKKGDDDKGSDKKPRAKKPKKSKEEKESVTKSADEDESNKSAAESDADVDKSGASPAESPPKVIMSKCFRQKFSMCVRYGTEANCLLLVLLLENIFICQATSKIKV